MIRRTHYQIAGSSLSVETHDRWAADATDALFEGWYLTPGADSASTAPDLIVRSEAPKPPIPYGLETLAIAGGGTCHVDDGASYLEIEGSIVTIGAADRASVEVWLDGPLPLESPALLRLMGCGLAAALRRQRRFKLRAGAVIDPGTGAGVLIAGLAGTGKSTLTVNLAAAGWPYLTDGALLLGREADTVTAWPLHRRFSVTPETLAASAFLRASGALEAVPLAHGKHAFVPHEVFAAGFHARCVPAVILFLELAGTATSRAIRLSRGETMARLTAMSPGTRFTPATAAAHLAVLGALALQARGWCLYAGRDLLDAATAADVVTECVRKAHGDATQP